MDLRNTIVTALSGSVRPAYPTANGQIRIGFAQRNTTIAAADQLYAGGIALAQDTSFDLDIQAGLVTDPVLPNAAVTGLNGKNIDGETIGIDRLYVLAIRAASNNAHVISVENTGIWADGPLGLGGATVAGEGLHLKAGGEIILVNPAGWVIAGSGANKITFTAPDTAGTSSIEIVILGRAPVA